MKHSQKIIYGIRPILEALEAGKEIDRVFIKKGLQGDLFPQLMSILKQRQIPAQFVPVEKLNRLTSGNHQGVIAYISPIEYQELENLVPMWFENGIVPFVLILDGITDVRNFGSIARTAACAGINGIVIPARGSAQINADAIKTSAGALQAIPVSRVKKLEQGIEFLKNSGFRLIASTEKADDPYFIADYRDPVAIVMGSEDTGISPEILKLCHAQVKIPLSGQIKSLNVAVATGIIVFEALKQRTG